MNHLRVHKLQDMTSPKLAIVGSRTFTDYGVFCHEVDKYIELIGMPSVIVSGGASGADSLAERYAQEHGLPMQVYPPEWGKFGRAAGPIRNTQIVNFCTHLIAFKSADSVGTVDSINKAKKANKPLTIVNV